MKISKEHLRKLVREAIQEEFQAAPRDYMDELEDKVETCMYMIAQCKQLISNGYAEAMRENNPELAADLKTLSTRFHALEALTKNILMLRFNSNQEEI